MYLLFALSMFLALLTVSTPSDAEIKGRSIYDVRKVRWGMTMDQVHRSENWQIISMKGGNRIYQGRLLGTDCMLQYTFKGGKLTSVTYAFRDVSSLLYQRIYNVLLRKYGIGQSTPDNPVNKLWTVNERRTIIGLTMNRDEPIFLSYVDGEQADKESEDNPVDDSAF